MFLHAASWQNKQQEKWEHHKAKRERQSVGGVEPPKSASQEVSIKKAVPHPAGNRSCCHLFAPHGCCPPVWLTAVSILTSYPGQRQLASGKPSLPARWFLSARKRKTTERAWAAVTYQAATTGIKEQRPSVIMAWGHRPWLSQTSKHERRCVLKATGASNSLQLRSCMLPGF